ncbi:polysaccharide biosynthesis C-terminal domain-containing protein, partial [Campylobacter volucris]|uniref:polysaccharide biosynthesis C-terminal domain-containing protein n=1 Tax=Campylobacter volucris TaxID=1031542 RepID=UPI0018A067A0
IIAIFNKNNNQEFFHIAQNALLIFSFSFLFSWFGDFCTSFFTALNKPLLSLSISIIQSLILPFIFIYTLSYYFGLNGAWIASIVSEICVVFIAYFILRKSFKNLNF